MTEQLIYKLKTQIYESDSIEKELVSLLKENEFLDVNFLENVKILQNNHNRMGQKYPLLDENFYYFIVENEKKILQLVQEVQSSTQLYDISYFGLETLKNKYLLKTHEGYKESIDNFFIRVSLYIWQSNLINFQKMYANLRQGLYLPATPTLFNAGCKMSQLASCFLMGNSDSIEGIFESVKETAKISKLSGGVGLHVHTIRGNGSYIYGTNGTSNGIIPMLKVYNDTARYVDQGGGKRNGSFAIYLEPWHSDILPFLSLKKNIGSDEVRARDLFYALWVPNLFMEKVKNNEDWYLMNPSVSVNLSKVHGVEFNKLYEKYVLEGKYVEKIKARELWVEICRMQIETGSPYILYKDNCNSLSNQKNLGTIQSSNLCCEIIQYSDEKEVAVCNLSSIALPKFLDQNVRKDSLRNVVLVTKENCFYCHLAKYFLEENQIEYQTYPHDSATGAYFMEKTSGTTYPQIFSDDNSIGGFTELWKNYLQPIFNYDKLGQIVGDIVENLNEVIDRNMYPLEKCEKSNKRHRPMGIGVQGLADVYNQLLIPYDSEEAKQINRDIFETMYFFALKRSCSLSKIKGPYETFEGSPLSQGLFHFDLYDEKNKYPYKMKYHWESLRSEIRQHGVRNSLLIALMPTASTSQISGNTESFEPLTSQYYLRRTLNGEFYVINRFLQNLLKACHLWNQEMKEKLIYYKGSIQMIQEIPNMIKDVFRTVWEISQKNLIDMASERQYFVDQSQSFNIYLNNPSIELLNKIHFYGYQKLLKTGSYYIRTRAITSGQNFFISSEREKQLECESCSA